MHRAHLLRRFCWILVASCMIFPVVTSADSDPSAAVAGDRDPTPTLARGAQVFAERCALCHGSQGMGEGFLPLLLKGYPDTNLVPGSHSSTPDQLRQAIIWGGAKGAMNSLSPPWGDELTWTEVESLVLFVSLLRERPEEAIRLSHQRAAQQPSSLRLGARVFRARCALCHGLSGKGDGRMARVIRTPPPFDLTTSQAPAAYLAQIVREGGAALGRSDKMPPWKETLTLAEQESVVRYIKTLRE